MIKLEQLEMQVIKHHRKNIKRKFGLDKRKKKNSKGQTSESVKSIKRKEYLVA